MNNIAEYPVPSPTGFSVYDFSESWIFGKVSARSPTPKLMIKNLKEMANYSSYKEAFEYNSKLTAVINSIIDRKNNNNGKHFIVELHCILSSQENQNTT